MRAAGTEKTDKDGGRRVWENWVLAAVAARLAASMREHSVASPSRREGKPTSSRHYLCEPGRVGP